MSSLSMQRLAPPGVTLLIGFLAYTSQWLFHHIDPGPISKGDSYILNTLVVCIFICYWRTCLKDPGDIPKKWQETSQDTRPSQAYSKPSLPSSNRWCRKCEMFKPARAHHCKTCKKCILKMDHHCVWTANCVSHITIPHFIRFLSYAVASMTYMEYLLYIRVAILWDKRHLPSYLGPSMLHLSHLFILVAVNSFVLFMLTLLLGRTIWSLAINTWTIESWEIERHHTLLRRARVLGGYLDGPDGTKVRIEHQEFPWDVGVWTNVCQGMGTRNALAWLWPFARSPSVESGLSFEHNEIDDPSKPWPPPDPDRLYRAQRKPLVGDGFTQPWDVKAFQQRQKADLGRYEDADGEYVVRRKPFHERLEDAQRQADDPFVDHNHDAVLIDDDGNDDDDDDHQAERHGGEDSEGEEGWRTKEGERLADFGVDEQAEFYDEDDVPLGELLRRRQKVVQGG